jgi:hypothetical protein
LAVLAAYELTIVDRGRCATGNKLIGRKGNRGGQGRKAGR